MCVARQLADFITFDERAGPKVSPTPPLGSLPAFSFAPTLIPSAFFFRFPTFSVLSLRRHFDTHGEPSVFSMWQILNGICDQIVAVAAGIHLRFILFYTIECMKSENLSYPNFKLKYQKPR